MTVIAVALEEPIRALPTVLRPLPKRSVDSFCIEFPGKVASGFVETNNGPLTVLVRKYGLEMRCGFFLIITTYQVVAGLQSIIFRSACITGLCIALLGPAGLGARSSEICRIWQAENAGHPA